jgi:hypothetical protein
MEQRRGSKTSKKYDNSIRRKSLKNKRKVRKRNI